MKNLPLIALLFAMVFMACGGDEKEASSTNNDPIAAPQSQAEIDNNKIQNYLANNNIKAESDPSGLHYIITNPGEGDHPTLQNIVTMHYKGYKLDGTVFESSYDSGKPLRYQLGQLIEGWRQGVPKLGRGGKATLFIPSGMAYGKQNPPGIGANATLIFDVELLDFE